MRAERAEAAAADADVLIRGAGPVGCTLALALRGSGLRVALLGGPAASTPFRPIALSYASRLILERVGVWGALAPTAIETIHVSQAGGFGHVRLEARDADVPALGYVLDYSALSQALRSAASAFIVTEEVGARCVVHAEGMSPDAREKRYTQDALVALVDPQPASGTSAFERFTSEGPLALLPWQGRYAVVWSAQPDRARALASAGEGEFLTALAAASGSRPGRAVKVDSRAVLPLVLRVRRTRIAPRAVYIGNAAQTLHPVAGQGLNLGLRDAWELARTWRDADDPGSASTLGRYAAARRMDAGATIRATDWLAGGFAGSNRVFRAARGAGLVGLDLVPAARRFFARRMIFGPSALP